MTEPGQRHFGNTDAHGSHSSSKTSWGHCYSLKNSQEPRDGRCWQSKSSGTLDVSSTGVPPAPWLFPCWWGCPSEARQTPEGVQRWCNSWQVHSLSSSCHPLLLLLRAALCILKTSHPGCNVNKCRRKAQLRGQSWVSGWARALYLCGNDTFVPLF